MLDSSRILSKYLLPDSLKRRLIYGGDLEYFPSSNKCIYFSSQPLEAYHLNSSGVFKIQQVYNQEIDANYWIIDTGRLSLNDLTRMKKRVDSFLNDAVRAGRERKIPDSVIFWRSPHNIIECKLLAGDHN